MNKQYIKDFNQFVNESVSPPDGIYRAYWLFDEMKKGNKDVMFLVTKHPGVICDEDIDILQQAKKLGYGVVKVNKVDGNACIIHVDTARGKKNAERLAQIANSHGGYLADMSAGEAREIGELLDYDTNDIDNFVKSHYPNGNTSF